MNAKKYEKITKKNSEAYFNDFIKKKEISLTWFQDFLIDKKMKEENIDFSPQSLIEVWDISNKFIKKDKNNVLEEKELPLWYYLYIEYIEGYTLESLKIMEALIYYFGEVFIKKYNLKWEIFNILKPVTEYTLCPVIMLNDFELYPFQQITTVCVFVWYEDVRDKLCKTNLYDAYISLEKYLK